MFYTYTYLHVQCFLQSLTSRRVNWYEIERGGREGEGREVGGEREMGERKKRDLTLW